MRTGRVAHTSNVRALSEQESTARADSEATGLLCILLAWLLSLRCLSALGISGYISEPVCSTAPCLQEGLGEARRCRDGAWDEVTERAVTNPCCHPKAVSAAGPCRDLQQSHLSFALIER